MTEFVQNYTSSHTMQDGQQADLIVYNGKIYTVDKTCPWVEALAIKNSHIIARGKREDVSVYEGDSTVSIDLQGKFVMPGLYDMHTHPDLALAPSYSGYLNIGIDSPSPAQVTKAICDYAVSNLPNANDVNGWIYGSYWVRFTFREAGIVADKHWLDSIISDRPIAILDRSWGCILVNSKALALAGIDDNTPDPSNGYIERDPLTNEATGILVDGAYALIHAAMPPTPQHALQRAYSEGAHFQSSRGVVATKYLHVCEHRLNALKEIDNAGKLSVRVEAAISWQDDIFPVERRWQLMAGERHYYASRRLNANAVKFHFDGTHESKSSFLSTPWQGESDWRGHLNMTPSHLIEMLTDLDKKGIRVIAHCTGDGASDLFLDAVAETRRRNGPNGMRHQCAHSTVLLNENLARFAELNVVAEFSPVGWFPSPFAEQRLVFGEQRWDRMYNIKGVLDAGGVAVMGTDWPVSSFDPWIGFEAMVTRKSPFSVNGKAFYGEPISLEQAIEVMTINGAWSMGIEDKAGSLEVGKAADFIVLDNNPFERPVQGMLHRTQVDLTFIDGQLSWDRTGEYLDTKLKPIWAINLPSFIEQAP